MRQSKRHIETINRNSYVPVLFTTHTNPEGTDPEVVSRRVEEWIQTLSYYTRTHILAVRGIETSGVIHEHGRVEVYRPDLERFYRRYPTFNSSLVPHSRWKEVGRSNNDDETGYWIMEAKPFDIRKEVESYRYILCKHAPVYPDESRDYFCPKRTHQCRKGNCRYIPTNK